MPVICARNLWRLGMSRFIVPVNAPRMTLNLSQVWANHLLAVSPEAAFIFIGYKKPPHLASDAVGG